MNQSSSQMFVYLTGIPPRVANLPRELAWRPVKDQIRDSIMKSTGQIEDKVADVEVWDNRYASCEMKNKKWARPVMDTLQNKSWEGSILQAWLYRRSTKNDMMKWESLDGPRDPVTNRIIDFKEYLDIQNIRLGLSPVQRNNELPYAGYVSSQAGQGVGIVDSAAVSGMATPYGYHRQSGSYQHNHQDSGGAKSPMAGAMLSTYEYNTSHAAPSHGGQVSCPIHHSRSSSISTTSSATTPPSDVSSAVSERGSMSSRVSSYSTAPHGSHHGPPTGSSPTNRAQCNSSACKKSSASAVRASKASQNAKAGKKGPVICDGSRID